MKEHYPKRLIIYTKDIENLTGQSNRSARRLLQEIREHLGKGDDDYAKIGIICFHDTRSIKCICIFYIPGTVMLLYLEYTLGVMPESLILVQVDDKVCLMEKTINSPGSIYLFN